jgi:HD-GYP domain-containing protein (c-di-GMP phosphodiesterase class II)
VAHSAGPQVDRIMMNLSVSNVAASAGFGSNLRVKELEEQVLSMRTAVICGFNQLLDLKDLNTGVHSTRLAEWAVRVAEGLGIDETVLRDVEAAAILHDIGKIGVPDEILKKPGKLTAEERAVINKHPEYGWAIQRLIPGLEHTSLFTLHHHENYDGTGYPGRLKGCDTPIGSRIVSVIDAFDAMVSNRPYRKGVPVEEAIRRLITDSGTQFDPDVVRCFIKIAEPEVADVFAATGTSMSVVL